VEKKSIQTDLNDTPEPISLPITDLPYSALQTFFVCAENVDTQAQVFFPLIFEATDSVTYLGLCFPDIYSLG
jgi:hypothetical protein